jgi:LmbE family N-acetylglucosaminyl deacetylase
MMSLKLAPPKDGALTILCLGAHSDDIEIGCGGTILKLIEDYDSVVCYWVVFSANAARKQEARRSAEAFLAAAKRKTILINKFKDGFFPYYGREIKESFEDLKKIPSPDIVFSHYRSDLHQDHRVISELTWNTFREHLILEYEIPKYDGDLGSPNLFVPLTESISSRKTGYLMEYFKSQQKKQWFGKETFEALMRLRGVESNAAQKHAEAYYCRKMVL